MVADNKTLLIYLKANKKKPEIEIEGCSAETINNFFADLTSGNTAIRIADFIFDREEFYKAIAE